MNKHQLMKPEDCTACREQSDYPRNCMVCDGGLGICKVCGALEGALASECPGVWLTPEQCDEIYEAKTDFKGGQWVTPGTDLHERHIACE